MLRLASLTLALFAVLAAAPAAFAQSEEDVMASIENIHGDSEGFFELFGLLQDAMMFGDPTTIAANVTYPITIAANGESYEVASEQDMLDNFDTLISTNAQEAIRTQDVADLIVTSEGVGFGDGQVWVSNICADDSCTETHWGITAINN
ncbi:MAG: hypothetical protein JWR51_2159 [Devosia sp.]|uniref:hypothetical protein n=1 Tax=Devosia sp. TaxID=1871048 RepID=UPI00260B33D2|nr:hypothetical protein [Devosia sp.]MDB5529056.1 hypothetical protein [Devosia sp.]